MECFVAGLHFAINGLLLPEPWPRFCEPDPQLPCAFTVQAVSFHRINRDISYFHLPEAVHFFEANGSIVAADARYEHFYVFPTQQTFEPVCLAYLFYTHGIRRKMLHIHGAVVETEGRGILFLGPSGIGKTTQAERWAQYRGATIINGDVVFAQHTAEGGYLAWGTPWHGSSPYCVNTSVPLKALVVLKQAPYNALRELTGFEKVSEVSGSVFYPTWLEDGMELGLETLNHLLTDLPVYRLDNRADQEAVDLLARELERL